MYTLNGPGTLTDANTYICGCAVFDQSDGNHNVSGTVYVGYSSDGIGIYRLSNTGVLTAGGGIRVGADGGSGTFEWWRQGGVNAPFITLGTGGTLSFGQDFNVGSVVDGTMTAGVAVTGLNVGGVTVTHGVTATHAPNVSATLGLLRLGATDGNGTYVMSGGGLNATTVYVGDGNFTGTFILSGGQVTEANLYVGFGGPGLVAQTGGQASVATEYVGYAGPGLVTQSDGNHTVSGRLSLGYNSGSYGTYRLTGAGTLNVTGTLAVGDNSGTGRFEWFRTGGLTVSVLSFSTRSTLAFGVDLDVASLINGSLFGGASVSNLRLAALEVTNGATATQNSGSATFSALMLGTAAGSGTYVLACPATLADGNAFIGSVGTGSFVQSDGNHTMTLLRIGDSPASTGAYALNAGRLTGTSEYVGYLGTGSLTQNGGSNSTGGLYVGYNAGSRGTYSQNGGSTTGSLYVGYNPGSAGTYTLSGGTLTLSGFLDIGYYGAGVLNIGNASGTGSITQTGTASACIRTDANASAIVHGWGTIALTGYLKNNGRVIADGFGTDRSLDLSSFTSISNTIENTSTNGWFATNHGKLVLPAVNVDDGDIPFNWGEGSNDAKLDLVNSLRATFDYDMRFHPGTFSVSLLSPDRGDVASGLYEPIGIWRFTTSGLTFSNASLTFRYDDALASAFGIDANSLKLYQYSGGTWGQVTSVTIDVANDRLTATGVTSLSDFAISAGTPEPVTAVLLTLACPLIVRRRSRERHRQ
jgi:T5SS/PEP-CTERM-associated repeat protein